MMLVRRTHQGHSSLRFVLDFVAGTKWLGQNAYLYTASAHHPLDAMLMATNALNTVPLSIVFSSLFDFALHLHPADELERGS